MSRDPIESILERGLRAVAAPPELSDRVYRPSARRTPVLRWRVVFASFVAGVTAWALHPSAVSMQPDQSLSAASPDKLCGARVFGSPLETQFHAGTRAAAFVIAKADHTPRLHDFAGSTWAQRAQTFSSDSRAACLLCHEE